MFNWLQRKCIKSIYDLCEGEKGEIVQIRGKIAEHRYLNALGISVGQRLAVARVDITPRERIITAKVGDIEIILDKFQAHNILVEVPVAEEVRIPNLQKELVKII